MIHNNTNISLYLVRHAESEHNMNNHLVGGKSEESCLTKNGEWQSEMLRKRWMKEGLVFNAVYSSPWKRAITTAKLVFPSETKIMTASELVELNQGEWEGKKRSEIYTAERKAYINTIGSFFVPPGGESQKMVEQRISSWLEKECLSNGNYLNGPINIAVFSHGMVLKCLLHYVMGFDDRLIYKISLEPTSISILKFTSEGWFLVKVNDTSHLSSSCQT